MLKWLETQHYQKMTAMNSKYRNNSNPYTGYVVYSEDNRAIGVVSDTDDRLAICNLRSISNNFREYLLALEDKRFAKHMGIDIIGIIRAIYQNIKSQKITQGGSTITQQLARNILRDNSKNIKRKIKEFLFALKLENRFSKDAILELYFNNIFWGKKIYGLRAASLEYFSKEPECLSISEQMALLTLLRGPNYYLKNEDKFVDRYKLLNNVLLKCNALSVRKFKKVKKAQIILQQNNLQVYKNSSIPFIAKQINLKHYSILSSIDSHLQQKAKRFISECRYPTSLICCSSNNIIAMASSYGNDYPISFKGNVGSTLKPFIYSFLREKGIGSEQLFSTENRGNLSWNIREVEVPQQGEITLREALRISNNNVFANASSSIGIENVILFLSKILKKPKSQFVPASILGATYDGISLFELLQAYHRFFIAKPYSPYKNECISILKEVASEKIGIKRDVFLKTGTTNENKERYAIVGNEEVLFGFLRQGNEVNDFSKEGNFLLGVQTFLKDVSEKNYKWE